MSQVQFEIEYIDRDIVIINKPSGYVVHKTPGADSSKVVLQSLRDQLGTHVHPVHRLDRATSGALLFTLNKKLVSIFQNSLQSLNSYKGYLAVTRSNLENSGVINRPLTNERGVKQDALTEYSVLQNHGELSLVKVVLKTGRRNQIRRHFAHQASHIVGDTTYGKGWLNRKIREKYDFHELFLHCQILSFYHPRYHKMISIRSELPKEKKSFLIEWQSSEG